MKKPFFIAFYCFLHAHPSISLKNITMRLSARFILFLTIAISILFIARNSHANVTVSNLFSNSMVLQRSVAIPVWGKASAGESVTVQFNGQSRTATPGNDGTWKISFDPMNAGGPFTMTISGKNTITISDVFVGEVWQCAGQSNMDTRVSYYQQYRNIQNSFSNPLLRYYTIRQPGGRITKWEKCTSPTLVGDLSCLGFFFGRELLEKFDTVAIGLIVTAVGGTTIASWLDPASLVDHPEIKKNDTAAGSMYNTWVSPVVGCQMRGTVLIQGEQDRSAALAPHYGERFPLLITGWRKMWGIGDFPFYWVQLANYGTVQTTATGGGGTTADIREVQRITLSLPNTAMAVAIDIGDSLHFGNKQEAGRRLSLLPRALLYGETALEYSGPHFTEQSRQGSTIHCRFSHCTGGLSTKENNPPEGFAIAGADKRWVWGNTVIHGDSVSVTHPQGAAALYVRYAYAGNPVGNLTNTTGLPASPFSTENVQTSVVVTEPAVSVPPFYGTSIEKRITTVDISGRLLNTSTQNSSMLYFRNNVNTGMILINGRIRR
jgi:sialate O-acetylesterase